MYSAKMLTSIFVWSVKANLNLQMRNRMSCVTVIFGQWGWFNCLCQVRRHRVADYSKGLLSDHLWIRAWPVDHTTMWNIDTWLKINAWLNLWSIVFLFRWQWTGGVNQKSLVMMRPGGGASMAMWTPISPPAQVSHHAISSGLSVVMLFPQ